MESVAKIKELKEKIDKLQSLMEDFINLYEAKKNKIANLETEIKDIKDNMNKHIDELEEIMDNK
tara:strand:- start:204 stop:395 length:192 start_codon:yes stop_codon:yes gene_type:complete